MRKIMLPKVNLPTFEIKLDSQQKPIKYRVFTVGEQEILLKAKPIANQESDPKEIISAVKQVVSNCLMNKVDVNKLPMYEVILLFVKIRAQSVGEMIKFTYIDKSIKENEDGTKEEKEDRITVDVNLNDVKIKHFDDHQKLIKIDDDFNLEMRYLTFSDYEKLAQSVDDIDFYISVLDTLWQGEKEYSFSEYTREDKIDWYDDLPFVIQNKIEKFVQTSPSIYYSTEVKLRSGKVVTLEYKTLDDFFA